MHYLVQHTLPWSPMEDFLVTVLPSPADTSDSVTRVIDSTRVMIFGNSDSTRVRLRKMVTRIESRFHRMTRLESQSMTRDSSQSHFCKISEPLINKPSFLHTKKWSFFGPVMIQIAANFLFRLSSRVILYPKGQVFITCTEVDLRFAFHWGARRVQYTVDLLTHHHDPIRYLHIVIMAVGHILFLCVFSRWSDLSYLNTNPKQKYTAQYNAYPNSCHCY